MEPTTAKKETSKEPAFTDGLEDLTVDLYEEDPAYVFVHLGGERRRCRQDDLHRAVKKLAAAVQQSY